jgi:hypothetical protein
MNVHRPSLEGRELGFVCLEDCDVWFKDSVVAGEKQQHLQEHPQNYHQHQRRTDDDTSTWIDISVPVSQREQKNLSKKDVDTALTNENALVPESACPHCYLIITKASGFFCLLAGGPRFNGSIQDTKSNAKDCRCNSRPRQRSDAALMLGVALVSHDIGHFNIRSIKVGRHLPSARMSGDSVSQLRKEKATILVTFTCLEIVRKPTRKGVFEQRANRRFITNSAKSFPPCTQLLLSLMSSDWKAYDAKIKNLTRKKYLQDEDEVARQRKKSSVSFFPSKMTLENVYQRIGGALSLGLEIDDSSKENNGPIPNITTLPGDVLCHRIGSFLRAWSVDALRCTCKGLHLAMGSVVPGLNLKLYRHQVKSLLWMRWRETRQLCESDLLPIESQSALQRLINSRESDAHRAATGGRSTVLCPREEKDGVRISQANGDELETIGECALSRPLARGGMICDEPGLGKTITVVSLILQTMGLSTQNINQPKEHTEQSETKDKAGNETGKQSLDEKIFTAYWKENVIPEFRRQALSKLFATFLRSSTEINYFLGQPDPVNSVGSEQNSSTLKEIKERIHQDVYGDSFAAFQTDVELCFMLAMISQTSDSDIHQAAKRLAVIFTEMVKDFKEKETQTAKKSFSISARRPHSTVAALVESTSAERIKNALLPSSGTLLVVPSVLLDHWIVRVVGLWKLFYFEWTCSLT